MYMEVFSYVYGKICFGLNRLKRGQKSFSQLQLSPDTDKLKSWGLLKLYVGTVINVSVPKCISNIEAYI